MGKPNAGMRKRPNGGYEYRFYIDGKRYSVGGETTEECKKKAREKTARIMEGLPVDNDQLTLDQYFKEWIKQKERSVKAATILSYTTMYRNHIAPALGRGKIATLQRRSVVAMLENIADTVGIQTANYTRVILTGILNGAIRDEIISRNVAASIQAFKATTPPARETIHRELNEEELRAFFSLVKNSIYYNAFRFMLYTGVRVGECLALQWHDVDFLRGLIHIRKTITRTKEGKTILGNSPKTRKSKRDIPMNEAVRTVLSEQLDLHKSIHGSIEFCGFIFPNEKWEMASSSAVRGALTRSIQKGVRMTPPIIIEPFGVHAFRDTFASRAVRAGIPPNTLKEILGHSSLAMTMDLYAHVSQQDKMESMKKMLAIDF